MSQHNIQIAHDLVAAWNAHDIQMVEAFYADDYEGQDVATASPLHGPGGIGRLLAANLEAFPDFQLSIEECVAQDDSVVLFWLARGTHLGRAMNIPPTGRQIEMHGVSLLKFVDGKIMQDLQLWDMAGMLRSIGLLPDLVNS